MITAPDFQKKQIIFVYFNDGEKMSILNDNIIVKDKDGTVKLQCTCYRVFLIYAIGYFSITSAVVERAKKFGFFIACMTTSFRMYDIIGAKKEGNTLLKAKQYETERLDIARKIVKNKMKNQRYVLMHNRNKTDEILESVKRIDEYLLKMDATQTLYEITAYEGLTAKTYFKSHFDNVNWRGRCPRLKADYINSALDIGYSLLFTFVDCIAESYGFDTYVGVLHRQFYLRKSLVCDLIEPFRVLIDWQTKKSVNLKQIQEADFKLQNGQWRLKFENSKKYAKLFMQPLIENKDEIFRYIQRYYNAFMKGCAGNDFPEFDIGSCL